MPTEPVGTLAGRTQLEETGTVKTNNWITRNNCWCCVHPPSPHKLWEEHFEDIIGTGPGNSLVNSRMASACYAVQHLAVSDSLISATPTLKALSWGLPYNPVSGSQLTDRSDHNQQVLFANAELFAIVYYAASHSWAMKHVNSFTRVRI